MEAFRHLDQGVRWLTQRNAAFREVSATLAELMVHIGLMSSIAEKWPEEVQENWDQKVRQIQRRAEKEIREIQSFAEYYDEP